MNEKMDLELPCVEIARKAGFMSFKFDRRGGKKGWPDRGFWGPGCRHVLVEFKTPEGSLSRYQRKTFLDFLALGHQVHTVRSTQEFKRLLERVLRGDFRS